jgi:predicted nucleic acid-binding Zn ribbon protein
VKKISAAGFRLKGGGWYETDFKSGDKKKNLAGESSAGGSSSASEA